MHRAGDYVFVHAGIDPDIDLDAQDFTDLLLIREPVLNAGPSWRHSFCVVHGHSISMPIVDSHRIGVDAGCYVYGALCSVQIENERMRFVGVSKKADFSWQIRLGQGGYWNWSKPTFLG